MDRKDYLILGVDITDWIAWMDDDEYENFYFRYDKYISEDPGLEYAIICDEMNGDFYFFGKVLAKGQYDDGIDLTVIDEDKLSLSEKKKLIKEANKVLGKNYSEKDVKLYCFTKWC